MLVLVGALALVYGALSVLAGATQLRGAEGRLNGGLMAGGGAVLTAGAVCGFLGLGVDWLLALAGCTLISLAALRNGMRSTLHWQHHVIRLAIAAVLTVGLALV